MLFSQTKPQIQVNYQPNRMKLALIFQLLSNFSLFALFAICHKEVHVNFSKLLITISSSRFCASSYTFFTFKLTISNMQTNMNRVRIFLIRVL